MAGTIGKLRSKLPKVESMHLLSEQDRAKKDYGKVELENVFRAIVRKLRFSPLGQGVAAASGES